MTSHKASIISAFVGLVLAGLVVLLLTSPYLGVGILIIVGLATIFALILIAVVFRAKDKGRPVAKDTNGSHAA